MRNILIISDGHNVAEGRGIWGIRADGLVATSAVQSIKGNIATTVTGSEYDLVRVDWASFDALRWASDDLVFGMVLDTLCRSGWRVVLNSGLMWIMERGNRQVIVREVV